MNRSQRRSEARQAHRQVALRAPVERSRRKHVTLAFLVGVLLAVKVSIVTLLALAAIA